MKKAILVIFCIAGTILSANAQLSVALHSNGITSVFGGDTPLKDAYTSSKSGDTLYVSGGNFAAPDTIDKGIVIIGAGYNPDSTAATQKTYLMTTSSLVFGDNCTNLYVEGIEFQKGLVKSSSIATNITIIRCKIAGGLDFKGTAGEPTNSAIIQCDIGLISFQGFTYSVISNCILRNKITYTTRNIFRNNVILYGSYNNYPIVNCFYSTFINNIFSTDTGPCYYNYTCQYNTFQWNIFRNASPALGDYATDNNNFKNIDLSTVYLNAASGDYHLLEEAKTTYLGDDGTQVGLYGGILPYKEGGVPSNPHIIQKSVVISPENGGLLNISFKVSAQQN